MKILTIIWIVLPLFLGFSSYLLPRSGRIVAIAVALFSSVYGLVQVFQSTVWQWTLLDSFGVSLRVDTLTGFFVLTNALVTAAVVLYCWQQGKSKFFYTQTLILHGSVNAIFVCADFMSLYVALEVIGIAAFLLIAYSRTDRAIWVGLRYLFVSNTAMLFYLIGAILVYQANESFAFTGIVNAPLDAIALIFLGLLTKGGIFVSGLWLPLTHSESATPVSALLSGVVVTTGAFPLARLALLMEDLLPVVQFFSVATAILGVCYAIFEKDTKRMLASSTISQLGFVLVAPSAAGFYALTHGVAKAALFLLAGNLPSRDFHTLRQHPMPRVLWIPVAIAALSISGFPLLAGFEAKALTFQSLGSWQGLAMNLVAVGTAIAFAKFLFLPSKGALDKGDTPQLKGGFWAAIVLLLGALIVGNGIYWQAYTASKVGTALATIALGWAVYWVVLRRFTLQLPKGVERFEHLIGAMSLMLMLLFGMVIA